MATLLVALAICTVLGIDFFTIVMWITLLAIYVVSLMLHLDLMVGEITLLGILEAAWVSFKLGIVYFFVTSDFKFEVGMWVTLLETLDSFFTFNLGIEASDLMVGMDIKQFSQFGH